MAVLLSNNATGRLGGSIDATQTSISLMSGDGAKYPSPTSGDWFPLTVVNAAGDLEVMRCTARSGDTLTVLRGQEGTIGLAFSVGDRAELRLTQSVFEGIKSETQTLLNGKLGKSENAVSATKLATARTINGVSFNGTENITLPTVDSASLVGQVGFFARNTPPTGWLKANGAAVSRTTYSSLFSAIGTIFGSGDGSTTFNLPDLRGEFPRGWDDGRGVDSGRALGSSQADAIRNIYGYFSGVTNATRFHNAAGVFDANGWGTADSGNASTNGNTNVEFNASRVVPTADENRPRNVALLACIKF